MKIKIVLLTLGIFLLAGCGVAEDINKVNPANQIEEKIDLKNQMEKDINSAVSQQNQKISEALGETNQSTKKNMSHTITIETNKGVIKFQTYDADAPKTVENFIKLAEKKFYDGIIFHRVVDGFMIQGGDPTGTGSGGPGYQFADELDPNTESYKNGYMKGIVAMANAGPNTNGSQFFIMVDDRPLPNNYTIFGKVISGQDVADAIAKLEVNGTEKPSEKVVMNKVTVEENK